MKVVFIFAVAFCFVIVNSLEALSANKCEESYGTASLFPSKDRNLTLGLIIITEQVKTLHKRVF